MSNMRLRMHSALLERTSLGLNDCRARILFSTWSPSTNRAVLQMPLKYRSTDRFAKPDPVYQSKLVAKFIGCLLKDGKRSLAEQVFYEAMQIIKERIEDKSPLEVFEQAIENIRPVIEVRSRRIGGMTYQVPTEVGMTRRTSLSIRWILEAARGKKGRPMHLKLADELLDGYHRQGTAYEKRENIHKMAEANRDFAHFARR